MSDRIENRRDRRGGDPQAFDRSGSARSDIPYDPYEGMSVDEIISTVERIARSGQEEEAPLPLYKPPVDTGERRDPRQEAPKKPQYFEESMQLSREMIERELEARKMEQTLQMAAVNTALEILQSEVERGRAREELTREDERERDRIEAEARLYDLEREPVRFSPITATRMRGEKGETIYGIEDERDIRRAEDRAQPSLHRGGYGAYQSSISGFDVPDREAPPFIDVADQTPTASSSAPSESEPPSERTKKRRKKASGKRKIASDKKNDPAPQAIDGSKSDPKKKPKREKKELSVAGWVKLVALVCVCAFFIAATIRIFFIPTNETIYMIDDSNPEYIITDDYIPPATMAVISNVSWQESDALAILETSTVLGQVDAKLLAQADNPASSSITTPVNVYVQSTGQVVTMDLEEYLIGVVSAEVPASYNFEAIKAQAIAARTYTVRRMSSLGGTPDGKGGDVCTSPGHCQAYYSTDELRSRWGGSFDKYYDIIKRAVYETQGLIMTYGGSPINAFYHANSGGMTENCELVFVQALPYLRSVESPGESAYSSYSSTKTMSRDEFASTLSSKTGAAITAADLENQVIVTNRTSAGRIYRISIGGAEYKGTSFQSWFSLRSTNITISYTETDVTFTVLGYGHGVGMSQTGANAMAGAGNSCATILKHYYTGVAIVPYM